MNTLTTPLSVRFSKIAILIAALAVDGTSAGAEPAGWGRAAFAQAAVRACGGDVARLCVDVVPGGGRLAQCLWSQEDRLSPDCRTLVAGSKATQAAIFACAADAQRHCTDVAPGGGRVAVCLAAKRDLISRECAKALDEASAALQR